MEGLQRSAVSFRRQGSSGIVWDDRFLAELSQMKPEQQQQQQEDGDTKKPEEQQAQAVQDDDDNNNNHPEKTDPVKDVKPTIAPIKIERSRSNGEKRSYRTGKVSPAIEPPSPKVSACGFCSAFGKGKQQQQATKNNKKKAGKRRSR